MIRFTKNNYNVSGSSVKENQRLIQITKNSTIVFNSCARSNYADRSYKIGNITKRVIVYFNPIIDQ